MGCRNENFVESHRKYPGKDQRAATWKLTANVLSLGKCKLHTTFHNSYDNNNNNDNEDISVGVIVLVIVLINSHTLKKYVAI